MNIKGRLFVSFSGGETSAYMTLLLLRQAAYLWDDIQVIFANTGQENEATLQFVENFSQHFDIPVTWVEAVVHHTSRRSCTHRIVDFDTASRDGEPFEEVIKKYGIPNQAYPHCTRELKLNPMLSYVKTLGWVKGRYDTAVGIRVDEIDRVSAKRHADRLIYPLIELQETTKKDVNAFWANQPFRLDLKGYQGNCKWCWKKSNRKHIQLLRENPRQYDFPEKMERKYGLAGHNVDGTHRVFFRQNTSTLALRDLAEISDAMPPEDDAQNHNQELDQSGGCSESCEVY